MIYVDKDTCRKYWKHLWLDFQYSETYKWNIRLVYQSRTWIGQTLRWHTYITLYRNHYFLNFLIESKLNLYIK